MFDFALGVACGALLVYTKDSPIAFIIEVIAVAVVLVIRFGGVIG